MTTYNNFSTQRLSVIQTAVRAAGQLAIRCMTSMSLSITPNRSPTGQRGYGFQLRPEIIQLLREAFAINNGNSQQIDQIRNKYSAFSGRMNNTTFQFDSSPTAPNRWDHAAYVVPSQSNQIYIRNEFFRQQPPEQALMIIHEYIHLLYPNNPGDGHPGGMILALARTPQGLGIPFDQAVRNPYCYDYYGQFV